MRCFVRLPQNKFHIIINFNAYYMALRGIQIDAHLRCGDYTYEMKIKKILFYVEHKEEGKLRFSSYFLNFI
jgi:hypothetical protein